VDYLNEWQSGGFMSASYIQSKSWKIFLGILLSLSLNFAACSKMQGPSEEGSKGVVEAPPVDPCEQQENVNNILCQWVATEMTSSGSKMSLDYDSEGRPSRFITYDASGNKTNVADLVYSNYGLSNSTSFSQPTPAPSGNFTVINTQSNFYNADGSINKIEAERKTNGVVDSTSKKLFDYNTLGKVNITDAETGGTPNPNTTGGYLQIITKDSNGKIKSIDTKRETFSNNVNQVTSLESMNFDYDAKTGRLTTMVNKTQDCSKSTCSSNNLDPNKATLDPIVPTQVMTSTMFYDDQNRAISFTQINDGDTSKTPIVPPDGTPDSTQTCDLKYEIQTQANIAFKHPIMNFIDASGGLTGLGFELFSIKDLFSTFSCNTTVGGQTTNQGNAMTFKWVRFWQVLPGGQPPGGSNP
jgi:hypothetical protein